MAQANYADHVRQMQSINRTGLLGRASNIDQVLSRAVVVSESTTVLRLKDILDAFDGIHALHPKLQRLPAEIMLKIYRIAHPTAPPHYSAVKTLERPSKHPALTPPANGNCPFLDQLSIELRRKILVDWLPQKSLVVRPFCGDEEEEDVPRGDAKRKVNNPATLLMLTHSKLKDELSTIVCEERKFAIHVHEGMLTGGIEFLDAGRQPLQYMVDVRDDRFARFKGGEDFGFRRLKKIQIVIFPANEDTRHRALNTYFMNLALARMLQRGGEKNRIVSLEIIFSDEHDKTKEKSDGCSNLSADSYWWDLDREVPRSTSIHGVTDVELVLSPFAILTAIHNASIILPSKVKTHAASTKLAQALRDSMMSNTISGTLPTNVQLELHVEILRNEVEELVFRYKYGAKGCDVDKLTEADMDDDKDLGEHQDFGPTKHHLQAGAETGLKRRKVDAGAGVENVQRASIDVVDGDEDDDNAIDIQRALMQQFSAPANRPERVHIAADKADKRDATAIRGPGTRQSLFARPAYGGTNSLISYLADARCIRRGANGQTNPAEHKMTEANDTGGARDSAVVDVDGQPLSRFK